MIRKRPTKLKPQTRVVSRIVDVDGKRALTDQETRTVSLSFSSEEPVDMWYGTEILSHAKGAVRVNGARQANMPLLFNHNRNDLLGIVEDIEIKGGRGYATVRFGKDERGDWAMRQADDGVLCNVSFMYRVFKFEEDTEKEIYTATDWEPYEISLVTVPADATVGVGRGAGDEERDVEIIPVPKPASAETLKETTMFKKHYVVQDAAGDGTGGSVGGASAVVVIDANRERQTGAEAERARIAQIEGLCNQHKIDPEVKRGFIQKGATVEVARGAVLDILQARNTQQAVDLGQGAHADMSEREKAGYSVIRALNASLSNSWKEAGFELEVSTAIAKRLGRGPQSERSFFIPTNIPFAARAAYAAGAPATGGALVATNLMAGSFIEVLRNKARVMQMGATVLSGLVGNVDIPRQTGASSTYWTSETGNTTESEATFDKISLTLKTIGTFSQISRNMLLQSTPDIDMIVRADLIAQLALGIDIAALSGSGSSAQPLGIANVSGIGSVVGGTNGAALTIDHLIDMETAVMAANAPEESLAYMANAKSVGALKKLKSTTGQYLWSGSAVGQRSGTPGEINGYPVARTNQARGNLTKGTASGICSEVFFGAWNELLIGEWGVLEIVPNPYDSAVYKNGGVLIRALQSIDIGVRHAASFSTMSDALTT
ncbi:phage major capsid protein, HK97 family [Nitrosospira sp. Nsp11]|uniref:phage major capsid protein n=1 Tax=Nitrosospira sp. Nsp11 TaxID=1855338 RepID=UPI000913A800|nr:phage major capsid protein [Nitrosospira sp. Nsp11]SHM05929.1 phage major capsid protein, HK97 family [Nitrosospira sp. Nsp11]